MVSGNVEKKVGWRYIVSELEKMRIIRNISLQFALKFKERDLQIRGKNATNNYLDEKKSEVSSF